MLGKTSLICIATFLSSATVIAADGDWPTFRGADRTGVATDTGLLAEWPADGPKLEWKAEGAGRGYSSLALSNGKMYTLGDHLADGEGEDEYLTCFSSSDGKQLWKVRTGPAWNSGKESWQSSRSTPTIDGDRIYALTAQGVLFCFTDDGAEVWKRDLAKDFGGKKADSWGYSESVLIDGDRVICTPGGEDNTMVALDKMSGEKVWSSSWAEDRGAGHASIVISNVGDTKVYVQTTGSGAMGVRAKDGKLLWTYGIPKTTAVIPTPIVKDDVVFFAAGYGLGGALLKQVAKNGDVSVEEIYPTNPKLQNKHGGLILIGDYLYGDSDAKGIPFCAELMTGEVKWNSRGSGRESASVTAADGALYIRYSDGTMTLVKATPEAFNEVGSFKIPGSGDRPSWSHPVVAGGKLFLRENDTIFCYDLKSK